MKNHLIIAIFLCLLLLPLHGLASVYYADFNDAGKVSESGNDIVLYFDEGKVWGHFRFYSNMTDNISADLYGHGSSDDSALVLQGVNYSEGETYDGGQYRLKFLGEGRSTLEINGHRLSKQNHVIEGMKWLGPLPTKQQIASNVDSFVNQEIRLAEALAKQLPKSNIGNTRKVALTKVNSDRLNQHLEVLLKALSRKPDSPLFKRFNSDPAFAVVYGLKQLGKLPDPKQVYGYENDEGKVGYTLKTCAAEFNIEDDEEGICQTINIYHPRHLDMLPILVEVEVHKTCLDDSCSHEYYRLHLEQDNSTGWRVSTQTSGMRCEVYRGGGSPPCP